MPGPRLTHIQAEQAVLLLVDLQDRLLNTLAPQTRHLLLRRVDALVALCQRLCVPILASAQYPEGLGPLPPERTAPCAAVFAKTSFSCLGQADLRHWLLAHDDRRQIWLAGVETHVCVVQTALDLESEGWRAVVVEDACASRDPGHRDSALTRLRQAGVLVAPAESIFYESLGDARHPAFRELAPQWR
ncbi:MAG: isochorismatase family protein [Acidithiobacillus sp.]